jgi:drug/metabolite transporter (DMT)-like permease
MDVGRGGGADAGRSWLGQAAILTAAAAYGLSTSLSVAVLDAVSPADLVAVELTGAAVVLFGLGLVNGRLRRDGAVRNFALGALMPGLAFVLGDVGLSRTSASAGSLLLAVELPLSVLMSVLFLREVIRGWAVVALALGLAGSAVVALGSGSEGGATASTAGNLLVVASVSAAAVFLVVTRIHNADDGFNASAWQTAGGAVCTSPFVLAGWWHDGSRLTSAGVAGWAGCLGLLGCTAVAGVAFNWGISRVPGVRASQLLNLTPVAGLAAAVVLLGERPSVGQLVGGALVLLAVVVLVRTIEQPDEAGETGVLVADEALPPVVDPAA